MKPKGMQREMRSGFPLPSKRSAVSKCGVTTTPHILRKLKFFQTLDLEIQYPAKTITTILPMRRVTDPT